MVKKILRILVLEDNEDDFNLISKILEKESFLFEITYVDTRKEFLWDLKHFKPDVILSDHSLPQFNSMEALKICLKMGLQIPFILVTGTVSEEFAVECLNKGADDYILKSNLSRLPSAIQNAIKKRENEVFRKKTEITLKRKNKELVKKNKELDSFVYSISHNLRSPLRSVLGLLHIAKIDNTGLDETMKAYLNKMEDRISKLDDTLKEIILYSKNSHLKPKIQEIDIHRLFNEGFDKLEYLNGFERVERECEVRQEAPLWSDAFRLTMIINNLLSNAIKYRDKKKEKSFLKVFALVDTHYLTLQIEDNGIGIDPEHLSRIYDIFFRATEISEGSGLGLYITRESIGRLKGKIDVQSRLGRGTTFTVSIPNLYSSKKRITKAKEIDYMLN